jgi:two-component system, NtrC family, sensor histidine kinase HydH
MDAHRIVSIVVCAAALAFAYIVWYRRSRSPMALVLGLLFLDSFAWTFAELAHSLTGAEQWHYVDRLFSTLMPAIALHVVVRFIGKDRVLHKWVIVQYALFFALALTQPRPQWWFYLFVLSCIAMSISIAALWRHRRSSIDRQERERTELIVVAIAVATLLGATDLWHNEFRFNMPPLGNVGVLLAICLVWIASHRSRLLDRQVPLGLVAYASSVGALLMFGFWATVRLLNPRHGLWGAFILSAVIVTFSVWREVKRHSRASREQARRHSLLGRLSEQLAHDLRNPLAALKGALQFLAAERSEGRSLDAKAEFLDLMLEQVARLERTVGNYQRLAKVEPVFSSDSLNAIVERVLSLQRFGLPASASVRVELAPDLPSCRLDSDLVMLALENLLRNACEAMPEGGVVTVRTERIDTEPPAVSLCVTDDGRGMDARELERALDDFYTTKKGGTGLGLSFVRRVARAHLGDLRLESTRGIGTTVSVFLPVADLE